MFEKCNARVAVVTNEFHLFRAKIVAEKAGFDAYNFIVNKTEDVILTK
jgi:uncharacterized SAM-binding protein YcdF (DUF218 family)